MKDKRKTEHGRCSVCNKPISFSLQEQYEGGGKVMCRACRMEVARRETAKARERKSKVMVTRVCGCCGLEFSISVGEMEWYQSKGFVLPVRCHDCRAYRRQSNKKEA